MKKNCWEHKNCGRQAGGAQEKQFGACPATTEKRLHGTHGGTNAGRACWVIAGTLCAGKTQGEFAKKFKNCLNCDFYRLVKNEEKDCFILTPLLLKKLKDESASK
ncbi:MAG: two-CW domain-containing protein [Candidatus Omnitrophota bacterium]